MNIAIRPQIIVILVALLLATILILSFLVVGHQHVVTQALHFVPLVQNGSH
jgi:hypothetical protein